MGVFVYLSMKKLIIALGLIHSLTACKTVDCWVKTEEGMDIIQDTVDLYQIHMHYLTMDNHNRCVFIPTERIEVVDTLYFQFYSLKRVRKCDCELE